MAVELPVELNLKQIIMESGCESLKKKQLEAVGVNVKCYKQCNIKSYWAFDQTLYF